MREEAAPPSSAALAALTPGIRAAAAARAVVNRARRGASTCKSERARQRVGEEGVRVRGGYGGKGPPGAAH